MRTETTENTPPEEAWRKHRNAQPDPFRLLSPTPFGFLRRRVGADELHNQRERYIDAVRQDRLVEIIKHQNRALLIENERLCGENASMKGYESGRRERMLMLVTRLSGDLKTLESKGASEEVIGSVREIVRTLVLTFELGELSLFLPTEEKPN